MPAASNDAATALAIMRGWQWRRCDPDGEPSPPGMDLGSIINRLAIEGIRRPQDVIIQLLCQGDLVANGSYCWHKYQDRQHYQYESACELIGAKHWQKFAEAMHAARSESPNNYFDMPLQLTNLGLKDCEAYGLDTHNSNFTYAMVTDQLEPWDSDYLEEWFSAWEIEAWPAALDEPGPDEFVPDANEAKPGRGRSPAKWWPAFAEELALTIHEEGIPEGMGHDGQSELLDKVFARLSAAGKSEPSRTTVQPVINAVLARIRSAGK